MADDFACKTIEDWTSGVSCQGNSVPMDVVGGGWMTYRGIDQGRWCKSHMSRYRERREKDSYGKFWDQHPG